MSKLVCHAQNLLRPLVVGLTTAALLLAVSSPAAGAGGLVKPDFCYVTGTGTADAVVTFVLSKLTITNPGAGGDNADSYQIRRSDGQIFTVERNEKMNIHDRTSLDQPHTYDVAAASNDGRLSNYQPCVAYDVVSSISPGRLKDWQRSEPVFHTGGDAAMLRSSRSFSGADHDAVATVAAPSESARLNPDGTRFAFQAQLLLDADDYRALKAQPNPSWNVMQRGFASSNGGQWKMSLVTTGEEGKKIIQPQCIARDGAGQKLQVNSTYSLRAGHKATITCVVDDEADTIQVIVNGRADQVKHNPEFGDVNPHDNATTCWKDIANTITVGNKPLCGGTLTDDDRFRGTILQARTFKGAA